MKSSENGFTLIEILISLTVMALASSAAGAAIFQIMGNTERNSDYMTMVRQVENAGYWISNDTQMATSANDTGNQSPPNFLVLNWISWNSSGDPIYHTATYFFEGLSDGVGTLKRRHWSSAGANEYAMIAQYIYYNPDDIANTSYSSYQNSVLTVTLTSRLGQKTESKEYKIAHRPNF